MINFKRFQEFVKILLNPSIAIGEKRIRVLLNLNNEKLLYAICASSQLNILQSNAFLRKHLIPGTNIFQLKKLDSNFLFNPNAVPQCLKFQVVKPL